MDRRLKLIILWVILMVGYAFHALSDLMPFMWGETVDFGLDVAQMPASILANAIMCFFVPLLVILCVMYSGAKWSRIVSRIFAVLYLIINALHPTELIEHFRIAQGLVMPLLLIISILITYEAFKWRGTKE